ncbi:MAG: Gfo/Idh/MocA family oxidoreductase [Halanaerobiaceae bacterium]|nr:Gfo/Idh/MocA family oxidoreductase [Halanaerobiaceae bacterium]
MKKIRLGVIGAGMAWERLHWPAIQELGDKYEIAALCNRTRDKALDFARKINLDESKVYDDYNEMLKNEELDAVDLLVPITENYDIAAAIVNAKINLIAEKPMAATMKGAEKLLELHRKHPVHMMVAENYRYDEGINKIRELLKQGKIGDTAYFIYNQSVDFEEEMKKDSFAAKEWRQHPEYPGGTFLDAAIHDLAALRHIFGAAKQVYAMGSPQEEDFCPYRVINTQIEFQNGVIGHYSYYTDGKETQKPLIGLRIFGNNGELYLEEKNCGIINISYYNGHSEQIPYQAGRSYYNELLNFYNAMMGYEEISVTPEIEYGDLKMAFDILKSIENNLPIKVDAETENTFKMIDDTLKV